MVPALAGRRLDVPRGLPRLASAGEGVDVRASAGMRLRAGTDGAPWVGDPEPRSGVRSPGRATGTGASTAAAGGTGSGSEVGDGAGTDGGGSGGGEGAGCRAGSRASGST
jgi:hypothetical protein